MGGCVCVCARDWTQYKWVHKYICGSPFKRGYVPAADWTLWMRLGLTQRERAHSLTFTRGGLRACIFMDGAGCEHSAIYIQGGAQGGFYLRLERRGIKAKGDRKSFFFTPTAWMEHHASSRAKSSRLKYTNIGRLWFLLGKCISWMLSLHEKEPSAQRDQSKSYLALPLGH